MLNDDEKTILLTIAKSVNGRKILGFRLQEFSLLVTFIFGAALAYFTLVEVKSQTHWLIGFSQNSDAYHSAVTGTQFRQGEPATNNHAAINRIRGAIDAPLPEPR